MAKNQFEGKKEAVLLLEDGTVFSGYSFGSEGEKMGEISFTTGCTGYQELLTDPVGYGSIVVHTFPLIGNYGVNSEDGESDDCKVFGYIVREWCESPSNYRMEDNIDSYLKKHGVVGMYGIDTRALTRKIREKGEMRALLTTKLPISVEEKLSELRSFVPESAIKAVSVKAPKALSCGKENAKKVTVYDFGCKKSLAEALVNAGCDVTLVPWNTPAAEVLKAKPDGVLLSDAADDPCADASLIQLAEELLQAKIPVLGIGFGHQLLALASGFSVVKRKHGHRGENQPVTRCEDGRVLISVQNHRYEVKLESVDEKKAKVSYINTNDGSCEGLCYINSPAAGVQFHPEACGGPQDLEYLFVEFVNRMNSLGE